MKNNMFGIFKKKPLTPSKNDKTEQLDSEKVAIPDPQNGPDGNKAQQDTTKSESEFSAKSTTNLTETSFDKQQKENKYKKENDSLNELTTLTTQETDLDIGLTQFSNEDLTVAEFQQENLPEIEKNSSSKNQWIFRLKKGLAKSRDKFNKSMAKIVVGGGQISEELYEELEAVLLTSDMGVEATESLLKEVRERVSFKGLKDAQELKATLKEALFDLIKPLESPLVMEDIKPYVIMMVGVNGAGKTTTIGKLAHHFQKEGKSIILAAGDTFRAAAKEQLISWGERNNVTVITQEKGDSAAICYDTIEAAKARNKDVVLVDTAGRLPTQSNLMEEIKKVKRVSQKSLPEAPHEIILVLDANIGQNTINQVVAFDDALALTGLIITKLDGTAKGGIIAAMAKNRPIPIRYIGVGENIEDLKPFKTQEFVDAFFDD